MTIMYAETFAHILDESPNDFNTRLVYADWLEERGDMDFAFAQRWMAEHRRFPDPYGRPISGQVSSWDWWCFLDGYKGKHRCQGSNELAEPLFCRLSGFRQQSSWSNACCYVEFADRVEAEQALARALLNRSIKGLTTVMSQGAYLIINENAF